MQCIKSSDRPNNGRRGKQPGIFSAIDNCLPGRPFHGDTGTLATARAEPIDDHRSALDPDTQRKGTKPMALDAKSTRAKVRDLETIRDILDSYEVRGISFQLEEGEGEFTLVAVLDENNDIEDEPIALHYSQHPNEEQYANDDDYYDALIDLYYEKGGDGFLALLNELAPHLETPLLILTIWGEGVFGYHGAGTWNVRPRGEVEALVVTT
jgi:hypothetical protein